MRAHATLLPLDVLDMILACSPDYATLASAVTVCKTFHRAFQGRTAGILRDIAMHLYSERRELVREAIRAIRVENDVRYLNRWAKSDRRRFPSVLAVQFDDEALQRRPLTRNEAKELCKRVEDACALEVVYSLRHKDQRTGTTSRLSEGESRNFHYALHRLEMILSLSRKQHAGTVHWCMRENRQAFYRRFSLEAVFHIYQMYTFLVKCVADVARHHYPPQHRILDDNLARPMCLDRATIIIGTKNIMSVIQDPSTFKYPWSMYHQITYCKADLEAFLWPKGPSSVRLPLDVQDIVSGTSGRNIQCQKCLRRNGAALWNASNWDQLPGYFQLEKLCDFLPRKSAKNEYERSQLLEFLRSSVDVSTHQLADEAAQDSSIKFKEILLSLFKLGPRPPTVTPKSWICARCLDGAIAMRFWLWWASMKGETQQDCRYGFDCDIQLQRPGHAKEYNHICLNTSRAHKALKTAVNRALSAGLSSRSALGELNYECRLKLMWRAVLVANIDTIDTQDVEERYGQQLRWALQKYEDAFHAERKAPKATPGKTWYDALSRAWWPVLRQRP